MSVAYEEFIAHKEKEQTFTGLPYDEPDERLFPFQRDLVAFALRRGRAAIFADTGLGKSRQEAEFASNVAYEGRVLVLTPLAVAQQWVQEAEMIDVESRYLREDDGETRIVVTNYDMMHRFDASKFVGVVLDECFAPDTMIDVEGGQKRIEDVTVGDRMHNAFGLDTVSDVHRREVPFAVRVHYAGYAVVCSPNHPWFTQRGWVGAQDLAPGDSLMETSEAVRVLRGAFHPEVRAVGEGSFLRSVLFSEVADAPAGALGEGSHSGGRSEEGPIAVGMVRSRQPEGGGVSGPGGCDEPNIGSGSVRENLPHIESHEARTFRTWGERTRLDEAAGGDARLAWTDLGGGTCRVVGPTDSRLSDVLQARLGERRAANRNRGGWVLAREPENAGREEGREIGFVRVDRIAILEHGDPELDRYRDADGKLYFYDLGGTRHPSFSVGGVLVHNSSRLKDFNSATRNNIIEAFANTPYKLAATATPSPNDFTELGNHSEFLGVKSRVEMLAEYFVHDGGSTQDWRLKGHAEEAFWRWVCSWGAIVRKPSDLGYENGGYDLPPLHWHEHVVDVDHSAYHADGLLFAPQASGLQEQRAARRSTLDERVAKVGEIVARIRDEGRPALVWCELNDEADGCAAIIPDAIQVAGKDDPDVKTERLLGFADGKYPVLVSKASICGHGLNFQRCSDAVFAGASNSYEQTYQAVRRIWRYRQTRECNVHIVRASTEAGVSENYKRKAIDAERMADNALKYVRNYVMDEVRGGRREWNDYKPQVRMQVPPWIR